MRSTRSATFATATGAAALALLTLTACGGSDGAPSSDGGKGAGAMGVGASAKPAGASIVQVADSSLGRILVDEKGRTLYGFTKDKPGASSCDADCVAVWPALTSARDIAAGPGVQAALLTEAKLEEGAEQAVYGDWPLYYYVGDTAAGDVNGQGLDGEWFAIAADGKLVKKAE
ncbi:COG4315 family predicted lipoprotein [Streptomyces sp. NPDC003860]